MSRSIFFLVAGWVLVLSAPLVAQDAVLGQIYGSGVHAFFAQDYLKAHQLFTSAIDGHSQDPRCFYFRGLALLKLGRPQDAEIDFQQGAKLESSIDPARAFNVARSLERIQGNERSTLEQYRLEARMTVLKKMEDERRARYTEERKEERNFLQRQSEGAARPVEVPAEGPKAVEVPGETLKPAGAVPAAAPPANPFSTGDEGKAGDMKKEDPGAAAPAKPDAGGAAPAAVEAIKPDAAKPDAAKPAADANPFGDAGGAAKPDAAKPDAAKPAAAKPTADANPFGDAGGAAKPDAAKPDAAKPAADANPFGDAGGAAKPDAAKPDAAKPAGKKQDAKPADPDANPFGDAPPEKAADKPAKAATPAPAGTPFVEEPDKGAAKKPAAAPAGDKKPDDKKPTDDNPFGN